MSELIKALNQFIYDLWDMPGIGDREIDIGIYFQHGLSPLLRCTKSHQNHPGCLACSSSSIIASTSPSTDIMSEDAARPSKTSCGVISCVICWSCLMCPSRTR